MKIINNQLYVDVHEYSCNILNAVNNTIHLRVVTKKRLLRSEDFSRTENIIRSQLKKMKLRFNSVKLLRNTTETSNYDMTMYL